LPPTIATAVPAGDARTERQVVRPERAPRPRRRRVGPFAAVLAACVAIGVVAVLVWGVTRDDGDAPNRSDSTPPTTQPEVPAPLEAPFDALEEAVQP
jgi:hypothetical protein